MNTVVASQRRWIGAPAACLTLLLLILGVSTGCRPYDVNRIYGQRTGVGAESVNGTGVLANMFEQAGFKVTTRRRLSPRIENFQVLVWFPNDFDVPSRAERDFLENWLSRGSGRTLIYVGRDFEASPSYWRAVRAGAPVDQANVIDLRTDEAKVEHQGRLSAAPKEQFARWFVARNGKPAYPVKALRGPWAEGVRGDATEIVVEMRYDLPQADDLTKAANQALAPPAPTTPTPPRTPAEVRAERRRRALQGSKYLTNNNVQLPEPNYLPNAEVLLASDAGDVLVSRVTQTNSQFYGSNWNGNQILVVTNGSFLVNAALVNHEHRKLANRLIQSCGTPGKTAFLESTAGGLPVYDREPDDEAQNGFELFALFPLNAVLLHLVALGILFCFAKAPIFGRPQRLPPEAVRDFGVHITAAGDMLAWSHDTAYARRLLAEYHQLTKPGKTARRGPTGSSGAPAPSPPAAANPSQEHP